jgi:cell division protein FtsW
MIAQWMDRLRTWLPFGGARSPVARQTGPRPRAPRLAWDRVTIACVALLLLIGLVMVTSASIYVASGHAGDPFGFLKRQLFSAVLGLGCGAIAFRFPIETWERLGTLMLGLAIVGLLLVLLPGLGAVVNGSRRWIRIGFINFQWSEAARLLIVLWLAGYLVRREESFRSGWQGFLVPMGAVCAAAALMLMEPDMGAAVVLVATAIGLMFLAGARMLHVGTVVLLGAGAIALLIKLAPYRMKRLIGFQDPFQHAQDIGYQLVQSLIAIGRGEWFGVGLGESVQKMYYLPEAHTDFIFAVLAEEFGFAGIVVVVFLFMTLAIRALLLARRAMAQGKKFHAYVAGAFGLWIGMQALVNMGVTMGVLPTKGLTLPLLSYGRSSLLVTLVWVGIILRVHHEVSATQRSVTRNPMGIAPITGGSTA